MKFYSKLIKIFTIFNIFNIYLKAAILNVTLPNGTLKTFNDYDYSSIFIKDLIEYINFKIPLNDDSRIDDDWEKYCTIINNKFERWRIDIKDSETYNIKIVKKHRYNIKFTNPYDEECTNVLLDILDYDLTFSEILEKIFEKEYNVNRSVKSIEYFKFSEGKLYEVIDEAADNKKEIQDLENFIFDHNKEYLVYFPINITEECDLRIIGYTEYDLDKLEYSPNFYIPKNKTLKDLINFYLSMYNLNKDNVRYFKKRKKDKKVNIYLKKGSKMKYKHLSPEEEERYKRYENDEESQECLKICVNYCCTCRARCKSNLKKVKYENL